MESNNKRIETLEAELTECRRKLGELEAWKQRNLQTREVLEKSELSYRSIFDALGDLIHVVDENLQLLLVNKTLTAYNIRLGLETRVIGKSIFDVFPFLPAGVRDHYQEVFKSGTPLVTEESSIVGDEEIFTETRKIPIWEGGRVVRVLTVIRDITLHQKANMAVKEEIERMSTLMENMPVMVDAFDMENKYCIWNKECEEVTGYSREEILGKTAIESAHLLYPEPEYLDSLLTEWQNKGNYFKNWEIELTTKNGEKRIIAWTNISEHIKIKGISAWAIGVDVTQHKRVEAKLKGSSEELRNLARHLETVREEERTYVSREIHDIMGRGLTVLKMELFRLKKKLPEDRADLTKSINSISSLIDTSIWEVQEIATKLRPGMLDDLGLSAAIEWQADDFQRRTAIRCNVEISPEDIVIDKNRSTALFRIFQEALTNVVRHAEATSVKVKLLHQDDRLLLRVEDNGKGIEKEDCACPQSLGLVGIRERVYPFDGIVDIRGIPGKGTLLDVSMPVKIQTEMVGSKDRPNSTT